MPADLRMTPQRSVVHEVLRSSYDHPTATEVFLRAKDRMSTISLATVYNCLDALVDHGLIRQVNVDRDSSRFCANLNEHVHFHCEQCGVMMDAAPIEKLDVAKFWKVPQGCQITEPDIAIRGLCPTCVEKKQASATR
ncbi:Fur family transcriptional regulator [soil metagenome]